MLERAAEIAQRHSLEGVTDKVYDVSDERGRGVVKAIVIKLFHETPALHGELSLTIPMTLGRKALEELEAGGQGVRCLSLIHI